MQMNNIWLEILPHHHFPPKNPSRYLSLLISAAWNSLVLVWNALQGISVPANNETISQQFMRIPQILHLPLLGLAHSRHRRCSIPPLLVFFSAWNRCLLSKFCPSSFALEKNKAWVRSSKAHVSCGIESKELGYQVCYGTQISQISVKGLVTKLIQKWWWLGYQVCCHSQLSGVFRVSNFATFSFHFAFTNRIDFMKVTDTMAATLPDSEDSEEALHLNQRVKKSSAVKTSKLKYKVSLYQITLAQNIACKVSSYYISWKGFPRTAEFKLAHQRQLWRRFYVVICFLFLICFVAAWTGMQIANSGGIYTEFIIFFGRQHGRGWRKKLLVTGRKGNSSGKEKGTTN